MNRSQALAIFSSMETGKLLQALQSVGIEGGDEGGDRGYLGGEGGSHASLEPWNARSVAVPKTTRPQLLNQENLTVKMPPLQKGRDYAEPNVPEGYEDYMPRRPDVYG